MAGTKLTLPTGYEAEQRRLMRKQEIANALMKVGMETNPNMTSWAQVLGQLGNAVAGRISDRKAQKMEDSLDSRMLNDYQTQHSSFEADAKTLSPDELVAKYSDKPWLQEDLDPYQKAIAKRLSERERIVTTPTGYGRAGDQLGKITIDGTKNIIPDIDPATGQQIGWKVNPVATTGALERQGFHPQGQPIMSQPSMDMRGMVAQSMMGASGGAPAAQPQPTSFTPPNIGQVESGNRDFNPDGSPVTSRAGAMYKMQVMPSTAHDPGFGVRPAANDSAAEYNRVGNEYAAAMLRRYGNDPLKAAAAYNGGPGRTDRAIASNGNNFLQSMHPETQAYARRFAKPPSGMAGGKPYWMINGIPYDNPEGR